MGERPNENDEEYITSWHKFNEEKYKDHIKRWQSFEDNLVTGILLALIKK